MGITISDKDHKISLFADDVILMISDPKTFLPEIKNILTQFSISSNYKLNNSKSQILGLHIPTNLKSYLLAHFPFQWATNATTFLGIQLPGLYVPPL